MLVWGKRGDKKEQGKSIEKGKCSFFLYIAVIFEMTKVFFGERVVKGRKC